MYALDFLRAFMMLLGIVLHGLIFEPRLHFLNSQWNLRLFALPAEVIHTFRMPLFFCLSGLFSSLLMRKMGWRKFLVNRLNRIAVPFVLSLLTVGLLTNVFYHTMALLNEGYDLPRALQTGLSLRYFRLQDFRPVHFWFLYYLLAFIPVMPAIHFCLRQVVCGHAIKALLKKYGPQQNRFAVLLLLSAFPTVFLWLTHNDGNPTPRNFQLSLVNIIPYFYYFAFGWYLNRCQLNMAYFVPTARRFLAAAFAFTLLRMLAWSVLGRSYFLLIPLFYNLSLWCYIFGLLGLVQVYFNKPSALLQYVSDASYWIYLVHLPVIIFLKLFFIGSVSLSTFVLLLGLTLYLCLLSYNYMVRPTLVGKLLNGKVQPAYPVHKFPVARSLGLRVKRTIAQGYRTRYALLRP